MLWCCVLILASCSDVHRANDRSTTGLSPVTSASVLGAPDADPPIELPLLRPEDRWALREAHGVLVARCMRESGFDGFVFVPSPFPLDRVASGPEGLELAIAPSGQTSFGLNDARSSTLDSPPPDPYFDSLSEAAKEQYSVAMFGSGPAEVARVDDSEITRPNDGCLTTGENELYQSDEYFALESQRAVLVMGIGNEVMSSPAFADLLTEYRDCMSVNGFDAEAPWDARSLVLARIDTDPSPGAAAYEQQVATADAQCQGAVQYAARAGAVRQEAVRHAVELHPELEILVEIEQGALARAMTLL